MNKERIDAIRARCEAATPGPWDWDLVKGVYSQVKGREFGGVEDAEFTAHAREDIPALLEALEEGKAAPHEKTKFTIDEWIQRCTQAEDNYDYWKEECLKARARAEALERAEKSLRLIGYTDEGGELWKPPLGPKPNLTLIDHYKARVETLERAILAFDPDIYCLFCTRGRRGVCTLTYEDECPGWIFDEARFAAEKP